MDIADFDINLVEKAFLDVVAKALNMAIDKEIFPGAIPPGLDGAAVRVTGEKIDNQPHRPTFFMEFHVKGVNRREVLATVFKLTKQFPENNLFGTVNGETIHFVSVLKNHLEISTITDNGKIKYLGLLELSVMI